MLRSALAERARLHRLVPNTPWEKEKGASRDSKIDAAAMIASGDESEEPVFLAALDALARELDRVKSHAYRLGFDAARRGDAAAVEAGE